MRTQILGSGFVTGQNLVTNDQIARMMDTSDAWIRERSGVETRYYVEEGTTTSDLRAGAARKAIEDAGIAKEEAVYTSFRDRIVLFGDAGGAVVLRQGEGDKGLLGFQVHSDGANFKDLYVPGAGFARRPYVSEVDVREWRHVPEMNGRAVFKLAVGRMPEVVRELCKKQGVSVAEIDLLIAHQANLRINEMVQRTLGLGDDRVYNNIQKYGNTTAATIPIALDECRKSGRIKPGDLVCFVGLGSGF